MNATKILIQMLTICLMLSASSVASAELQGNLFTDEVVTVDGESFNIDDFDKALNADDIAQAEAIYDEWITSRQKMLSNGAEFGFFDVYIKHNQARILYAKKNYEQCIAAEDENLNYLLTQSKEKDINWINLVYNSMYFKKYSYDALQDYESSLHVQQEIVQFMESRYPPDNRILLKDRMWLADCYWNVKDYESSMAINEDLLPRVKNVFGANATETRTVKLYLAVYCESFDKYADAVKFYEEILQSDIEVYGENDNRTLDSYNKLRDAKILLAEDYHNSSKFSDAAKLYEEILQSDIEVYGENDYKTIDSYDNLITEYSNLQKIEEMGTLLNRAVPLAEQNLKDDSELKYNILMKQALYYLLTRQMQQATEISQKVFAMPISDEQKGMSLLFMAINSLYSEDYSNAISYTLRARNIYEKYFPENKEARITILSVMSTIYTALGNHDEAINFAQEAVDLSSEFYGNNSAQALTAKYALVAHYQQSEQYDKLLKLSKECYELGREIYRGETLPTLQLMMYIANVYYQLDDNESGIIWAKKAVDELTRLYGEKNVWTLVGWAMLAKLYDENKDTRDEAIKILETVLKASSEDDPFIDGVIKNLAIAYSKTARWKEAIPLYEKVIERNETRMNSYSSLTFNEKMNLISDNSSAYVDASELYYRAGNVNDAFRTLERGRSKLLIDAYSEQLAKSSGILDEKEIAKLNGYKSGLANYAKRIDNAFQAGDEQARFNLENEQRNLMNEYVAYKESLQNKYPKYKTVSQANKLDLERDKNILPDDTAFVEYMIWDSKTFLAFVFDKNSEIKALRVKVPKEFFSLCSLYRELLEYSTLQEMQGQYSNKYLRKLPDGNYKITIGADVKKGSGEKLIRTEQEFKELKQALSKRLGEALLTSLSLIKGNISDYSNLIISPDGDLNNIPFETLDFNGERAIDSFNISYVPSFSVLKLMHEAGEKNAELTERRDLFAMGHAFYEKNNESETRKGFEEFSRGMRGKVDVIELLKAKLDQWEDLLGSKEEINRVSKMFDTKKIFTEKSASESNLKLSNSRDEISKYRYLLFSAHGIFIPHAPEYSSIVLSQGVDAKEDGYVTIGEWMGLNLNSDLVFLSACESGLGEYQAGEGIIGIPYALTIAGNKDTVMSLWKVKDATTAEFVSTFFQKISEGKSALVALNETKREFLKSNNPLYQNPAIWAPFILYGF